jgi:crotonobetainyl-CoA:carnitine CoA-transferase CaiB-like acyl-CoA transferase
VTAFFGRGSLTDSMIVPGSPPPGPRPAQGDHTSSLALVAGILAALRLAERTGEGQVLDCNLLATAAWTQTTDLSVALIDGAQPTKRDRRHQVSALANRFECLDGRWIVLNMTETRWWAPFCRTIERPDWIDDPRFHSAKARFDNISELTDLIDAVLATQPLSVWASRFDAAGLIWGPAATLAELAVDIQAEAIGMYPYIDHPAGRFRTVAAPMFIRGTDIGPRGPAPEIGQHTREILGSAGLTDDEIAELVSAGVIGVG